MRRDAALHPHPPSVWGGWGTALKLESSELKLGMPSEATEGLLPCPAFPPITVWYLAEGLKVDAVQHPADQTLLAGHARYGAERVIGTELAPMSTTDARRVAFTYANSTHPLIFDFRASGMSRGCDISFLSVFPKEKAFLDPPLTDLEPAGTSDVDGCDVIVVTLQIS
eukprot:CAMPEP_0202825156 /NCGR_PEP_ID=MMETSP1389-20130828/12840_1 /ASSEMBLY_ACC=CAM_ASM_000865 /TAXON_ID=302021 /ORGANISM="Rhodomonas sp., Strain CCMP768" /LENGTH=167 /DNA_ID=CAMNT_0049498341 /DNA_START=144 /DNA_END=648 /DNA_ORIENTATION=+